MSFGKRAGFIGVSLLIGLLSSCQSGQSEEGQQTHAQFPSKPPQPVAKPSESSTTATEPSISQETNASTVVIAPAGSPVGQPPGETSEGSNSELPTVKVILSQSETLRTLQDDVLEIVATLPKGTELTIPRELPPGNYKYKLANGGTQTSSNYFYAGVRIQFLPKLRASSIDDLHALPGGLFLSSTIADDVQESVISPLKPGTPQADYLQSFTAVGKPKFQYSSYFQSRFGSALNKETDFDALPAAAQAKWPRVYEQLREFATRSEFVDSERLFIPLADAHSASQLFEQKGVVNLTGAWSIAVKSTAPRHGFGNVPCAEFVSEVLRQAYARAGYSHFDDFNAKKGNLLLWSESAAVVKLADNLAKAGWIPWEAYRYQPPAGAPMMHYKATTPGHAYLAGAHGGQIVVDNGNPRGRDLRTTPDKYIRMMYLHGVFFLPPGLKPMEWGK